MPPRSRPSARRRRRTSGTDVGRISGSPMAVSGTGGSEAGVAAKHRRTDSTLDAVSTGSGSSSDKNGTRNSFAATATPPRLGTPTTAARTTPVPNTRDRETDEDEADTLQRFSNVSVWQHAREIPPLNPAPTPSPPSFRGTPADAGEAEQAVHVSSAQRGGSASLSMERSPVFEQAVYGSNGTVSAPTPASPSASSPSVRTFSASLLSQLLMAEAACAEAAATAAQQRCGDTFEDGSDATASPCYAPPQRQPSRPAARATTECYRYSRDSGTASLADERSEGMFSVAASQSLLPMEYLTVCIGVVPLPGSEAPCESTAGRKARQGWPWSRTPATVRSDAAAGVVSETVSDKAKVRAIMTEVRWLAPLLDQTASVRQLRPRRPSTSGQSHTAAIVSSRSTSTASAQPSGARATDLTDKAVPISHTHHSGPAAGGLGWAGVFADVSLVLPAAQLASRLDATSGDVDGCLQSEELVCSAAASISVVLA